MSANKAEISVKTGDPLFDRFYDIVKNILLQNQVSFEIDGETRHGYRMPDRRGISLQTLPDIMHATRYFDGRARTVLQHFADTQALNGRVFNYFYHSHEPHGLSYVHNPRQPDAEYRFVTAVFLAWQASGDDEWLLRLLPAVEQALSYAMTRPWRWCDPWGVIKRPLGIDTWDFIVRSKEKSARQGDDTIWGAMPGDNSGYYAAIMHLAKICRHVGWFGKAEYWQDRAQTLKLHTNELCWNGRFYAHFVPIARMQIPDFDFTRQLSMSNLLAITRGLASSEAARSIIDEYRSRSRGAEAGKEWFSIDPPFPVGVFADGAPPPGVYANGGLMPFVGGQLALAGLENGFENYGAQALRAYATTLAATGESWLWTLTDGSLPDETMPWPQNRHDSWGSSSMLRAFVEGLCGIRDQGCLFDDVVLTPRWLAAGIRNAEVRVQYHAGQSVAYRYQFQPRKNIISLSVAAPSRLQISLMLPEKSLPLNLSLNGDRIKFSERRAGASTYVEFEMMQEGDIVLKLQPGPKA